MNWRLWLILALLTGALLSGWFAWHGDAPAVEQTGETVRSDYILRDFEVVTLDSSGQEAVSLRAPELQQTPGARAPGLVTPLFRMPAQHGTRWAPGSKDGWGKQKRTLVQLRGDVVADSPMGATRPTVVRTEQMDVYPEDNRATSATVVTITTPGTTMRGTGMEADLASKRIQLLSKVSLNNDP